MQNVIIGGFVGGNPVSRAVTVDGQQRSVTEFSVAVNNPRNRQAPPTWFKVSAWNGLGETVAKYVEKGDYVVVTASAMRVSAWINDKGEAVPSIEIRADSVDFSANRDGNGNNGVQENDDIPF